jgi:hypothetical protein
VRAHVISRQFVALLIVAGTAVACKADDAPIPPPPDPAPTSTAVPAKGLVVISCDDASGTTLTATGYSVLSGQSYFTSTIRSGTAGFVTSMPCTTGTALRQGFNLDYSRLAVMQHDGPDGRSHIGYADAAGAVTDVTDVGGVKGVERRTWPVFDAWTNRLWYRTPTGFGSIDLSNPGESREERALLADQPAGGSSFYVTPGGQPVEAGLHDRAFSEDGELQVTFAQLQGLKVSAPGESEAARVTPWPGRQMCSPKQVLDARRLLCIGPEGLFLVTFGSAYTSMSLRRVSPPLQSGVKIVDAMVNPDREHLAYLTVTSSVLSLYMKPLANDNTPVLVAEDVSTAGAGSAVLAEWRDG